MELQKQVTSLDLSQRLEVLNVKQESLFYWCYTDAALADGSRWELKYIKSISESEWELSNLKDIISAYTVAELGEILPEDIEVHETGFFITIGRAVGNKWYVTYRNDRNHSRIFPYQESDTEAEAHALMLEYLITNKLITL